jgi:hypothetical protein
MSDDLMTLILPELFHDVTVIFTLSHCCLSVCTYARTIGSTYVITLGHTRGTIVTTYAIIREPRVTPSAPECERLLTPVRPYSSHIWPREAAGGPARAGIRAGSRLRLQRCHLGT